jgi:hypothetical protein
MWCTNATKPKCRIMDDDRNSEFFKDNGFATMVSPLPAMPVPVPVSMPLPRPCLCMCCA